MNFNTTFLASQNQYIITNKDPPKAFDIVDSPKWFFKIGACTSVKLHLRNNFFHKFWLCIRFVLSQNYFEFFMFPMEHRYKWTETYCLNLQKKKKDFACRKPVSFSHAWHYRTYFKFCNLLESQTSFISKTVMWL